MNYEKPVSADDLGLVIEKSRDDYTVTKMCFAKEGKEIKKDTIIYNEYINIKNIPNRVYEYVINGKSAVEWIMERYAVSQDKNSRLSDDPNDNEHPTYIFQLLISVIKVSLQTQNLLDELPEYKEI